MSRKVTSRHEAYSSREFKREYSYEVALKRVFKSEGLKKKKV